MTASGSLRGAPEGKPSAAAAAADYSARPVPAGPQAAQPPAGYAGRTCYTLLEYEAILANAPVGIAFTRERRFFLCNPKFAELLGWPAQELIGKPGELIYEGPGSYAALAEIAVPVLAAGGQLDVEWPLKRKDGSSFLSRLIAKSIDPARPAQGTVWIVQDIAERKLDAESLQRVLGEQRAIFEAASIGILLVRDRRIAACNERFAAMYGWPREELIGQPTASLFGDAAEYARVGELQDAVREYAARRRDGSTFWAQLSRRAVEAADASKGEVWLCQDLTLQHESEQLAARALAEQALILEYATVGISFVRQRTFQRCNRALEEMFGYAPGEMIGLDLAALEAGAEGEGGAAPSDRLPSAQPRERRFRRKDGSLLWCKVLGRAIDAAQADAGSIWIYEDATLERTAREALERSVAERTRELSAANERLQAEIAERKQAELRAQHLADHDVLTGLPNRRLLEDRLTQAIAASQRNGRQSAVMFVDLDHFKAINDSAGHAAGDRLLKEMARRLVGELREVDTVCRLGGDEFVVVLPEIRQAADAAQVARKLLEQLSRPVAVEGRELRVTPSIGIGVFPSDGGDAAALIRAADAAMYHAKASGRANYQFFTRQMNQAASQRLAIEADLRRALEQDRLRLVYQPIVELATGRVLAYEALLRWRTSGKGWIPPADFLPVAEESKLMQQLGAWSLAAACRWAASAGEGITVAVNLSAHQVHDPDLAAVIMQALRETGLAAGRLELELPQPVLTQRPEIALPALDELRKWGISLALDGFGSGACDLSALQRLQVGRVKLDRGLLARVPQDEASTRLAAGLIGLARTLHLEVIATGVESAAQLDFLREQGCRAGQGFLLGRPARRPLGGRLPMPPQRHGDV